MALRLKLIACKVLYREISLLSACSDNIIDITYLRQGFHDTPEKLNRILQKTIDDIDNGDDIYSYQPRDEADFDAILLGYGLCSNSIVGLKSRRYKLVVPRAHDCASLFIGSREVYKRYFDSRNGGIYWYTGGWIENTIMPSEERIRLLKTSYEEKYGEDNAEYLMEMEQNWLKEYTYCTYVEWSELKNCKHACYTQDCAGYLGWQYEILQGDSALMNRFLSGDWNAEDFLIVPPGCRIEPSFDNDIIHSS